MKPSDRRGFFVGACQCAFVALSFKIISCGADESLSRQSVSTQIQSGDASKQNPDLEDGVILTPADETPIEESKNPTEEEVQDTPAEPQTTTLILSDINAISLYYDGTMGPQTGVITVDDMVLAEDKTYDFWHGHGGSSHQFTVTSNDFIQIRSGLKVSIETDLVDSHSHTLFIDPTSDEFKVLGTTREVEVEIVS